MYRYTIGAIDVGDNIGKEVITKYTSPLSSAGEWYTDANGRDSLKRTRNQRPDFPGFKVIEPVADNYFPVNTFQFLSDATQGTTLSVVTDRANGGGSLNDGELEFMLHRRLTYDDSKGVNEILSEPGLDGNGLRIRGNHRLLLDHGSEAAVNRRQASLDLLFQPQFSFADTTGASGSGNMEGVQGDFSGLTNPLPANVHILTTQSQDQNTVLIRLAHMFDKNEHGTLSQDVTVGLAHLFSQYSITEAKEMTLTGSVELDKTPSYKYHLDDGRKLTLITLIT